MTLNSARDATQIGYWIAGIVYSITGTVAAIGALLVYRNNSKRERARWAETLYTRFFEKPELKTVRDQLDSASGDARVARLVSEESAALTDYLNFFEFVAYLESSKQLSKTDVRALFGYYLDCLQRHHDVVGYVQNKEKGFEYLGKILSHEQI
jgi:hypothetical protein